MQKPHGVQLGHCAPSRSPISRQQLSRGHLRTPVCRADPKDLRAEVQRTNEALQKAKDTFLARLDSDAAVRDERLDSREERLWRRQDEVWKQEHRRWEAERLRWDQREAALQAQIYQLQAQLLNLAHSHPSSSTEARNSSLKSSQSVSTQSVSSNEAERKGSGDIGQPGTSRQEASNAREETNGSTPTGPGTISRSSVVEEAAKFLPHDDNDDFVPPSRDDFGFPQADDPSVDRVRNSLQAAFQAVGAGDILDTDFANLEKSLGHRLDSIDVTSQKSSQEGSQQTMEPGRSTDGPPELSKGDDDIFWMSQLHGALLQASLFPGDDDIETWSFGERTLDAVLTFQAMSGLPQTGIVNDMTWRKLLGENFKQIKPPLEPEGTPSAEQASFARLGRGAEAGSQPPVKEEESEEETLSKAIRDLRQTSELANRLKNNYTERQSSEPSESYSDWPVLREGDGGRNVHHLQVALERNGFDPDTEDQRWWQFGSSTLDCVYTFQACSSLAETGIVDSQTWRRLLGDGSTPDMLSLLTNDFEDDLADTQGAVWLVGEQRWSRSAKL